MLWKARYAIDIRKIVIAESGTLTASAVHRLTEELPESLSPDVGRRQHGLVGVLTGAGIVVVIGEHVDRSARHNRW